MTTTPRLDLPPVSIADAPLIWKRVDEAQAGLESAVAEIRTLLQQRNLLSVWDDEAASFIHPFQPIAARYHEMQRSLIALTGEQLGWQHDLTTLVDAQR